MSYALQTLWHERQRYSAGVLAVTFSAVLIALQIGLMLGLFKITSIPIDHASGDFDRTIWVGSTAVPSVDLGKPIPESFITRIAGTPGVEMPEIYIANYGNYTKPSGRGTELCFMLASHLDDDAVAVADVLTHEQRIALTEPFTIVVDQSDMARLGIEGIGSKPKINGREVTVVGAVKGLRSLAAPWVFCSTYTARQLLGYLLPPNHATYLLARCDSPARAKQIAAELREQYGDDMTVKTAEEFSTGSRWYWLLRTKAGVAIGYAALLGLVVGAVITYQSLYSATAASAKEFAILLALGIPRWRISVMVLAQSFWVGVIGILLSYPLCLVLREAARAGGVDVDLRWEVLAGTTSVTIAMAVFAGLLAMRSVRKIEPMDLLR